MAVPLGLAAFSPYLAYRDAPYVVAGFGGIAALALLLVQPLLARRALPGLRPARARRWHLGVGRLIVLGVALHIGGLYLTSPPDTLDALLLVSPTPFSVWGVLALVAVIATALLAAARRWIATRVWRVLHNTLGLMIVAGSVVHALLIEGTMEPVTKALLCAGVVAVALWTMLFRGLFKTGPTRLAP